MNDLHIAGCLESDAPAKTKAPTRQRDDERRLRNRAADARLDMRRVDGRPAG